MQNRSIRSLSWMRAFDRDLIRGEHYGPGHVNRANRPNTWLHRPTLQNGKKVLANPEPSTHGTWRQSPACRRPPFATTFSASVSGGDVIIDPQIYVQQTHRAGSSDAWGSGPITNRRDLQPLTRRKLWATCCHGDGRVSYFAALLQRLKELAERDLILGAVVNCADLCAPPCPDHRRREGGLRKARRFRPGPLRSGVRL